MYLCRCLPAVLLLFVGQVARGDETPKPYPPPAEVRAKLLAQLDRPRVPLDPQVRLSNRPSRDWSSSG